MYPNYNYPNVPSGSGGYPYMHLPMQPPVPPPMVPPEYNEQYAKWAQWNSHFAMNPTSTWRNQAAAAMRPTPYDRPVTIQHQVPYGGRPYVPRDLSGPNANTMRDSYGGAAVASTSKGSPSSQWDPAYSRPELAPTAPPVPTALNQQTIHEPFYTDLTTTLEFDVHVSSTKLDINWKPPKFAGKVTYELTVTEERSMPFTLEFPDKHTKHTMRAKAGETYLIAINARKKENNILIAHGQRQIKAIFSELELRQLYEKAVEYTGSRMHSFEILYRCKPKPYWDDIHHNCNSVMEKYMKDDNGQPGNMINGVISGLFFSARLLPNGTLPHSSPFGNVRMLVPAVNMLDPSSVNTYFADFYCNRQAHYVTIIVARKGSESDIYSEKYLLPLDMRNNPWLKYRVGQDARGHSKLFFDAAFSVWVEVLFTENVPLGWGRFDKVEATGMGTSKIGGLSNNKSCKICNLYPPGAAAAAEPTREELEQMQGQGREEEEADEEEMEKKRRRSISPGLVDEENVSNECKPFDDSDDLDSTPLPAYEMGGNSTFQTLINIENVNDYPSWTDLIECVCEVIDGVVAEEQRQITNFNSACDVRVAAAIEEMDSIVGMCDDDKIHDLAAEVHELAEMWQLARAELAKMAEARFARDQQRHATRAALPTPPPHPCPPSTSTPELQQRRSSEEELDEYLDDEVAQSTTATSSVPSTVTSPAPLTMTSYMLSTLTPSAFPTVTPSVPNPPATAAPVVLPPSPILPPAAPRPNWIMAAVFAQQQTTSTTVIPQSNTVGESPSRGRKKERRKSSKVKEEEEELDEYLDEDNTVVKEDTVDTKMDTVSIKEEIKQESTTIMDQSIDPLNSSEVDLSLFDEVNSSTISLPTTILRSTVAARAKPIEEEEDEYLEEDEEETTIDLKRSATDSKPEDTVVAPKKKKNGLIVGVLDMNEDELLLGSGPSSFVEITPEMEEELLGD